MSTHELPTKEIAAPESEERSLGGASGALTPGEAEEGEGELGQGDCVGRYSVLSCLGRGGMGVVYKAYDPQLDRNVALKLLRRGRSSVQADLRLLREAQTLAKLKHPNIVAVYDAGLTGHGVFIAMELLLGKTVNEWLEAKTRSVHEILEVFRAAGRGLVAAHEAGFVHRDFKPSNVLVDEDGSVRVLDFGLAHSLQDRGPEDELLAMSSEPAVPMTELAYPSSGARAVFATQAGTVVGTPAFMAPEQLLGDRGDHRSEQFAFAMSLYVALYDRTPLGGETYEERRATIEKGLRIPERDLERSASGELVPLRIRQTIVRGLASDPKDRFGSMEELLAQLEEPPSRWRLAATAGFILLAGFGVGAVVFGDPSEEPCLDPVSALEGTWGPDDRAAVEDAFARSGDVTGALSRVHAQLDGYAKAWVEMYERSCRATFVHHQQSERLFDQRMQCLVRRRNRLHSAIDALLEAETSNALLERTVVAFQLPGLEPCADLDAMAAEQPLPDDPQVRAQIATLRERLDEAETRKQTGDYQRGLERAEGAVNEARALGYMPVLGEALTALGRLQTAGASARDAEATLREAIVVAAGAGDAYTEAVAWIELLFSYMMQGRSEEGLAQELAARSAVARADDAIVRSWLLNNLGVLHSESAQPERAHEYLQQALEAKQQALGPSHLDVGVSWVNLGNSLIGLERYAQAQEAFEQALAIFEATVGEGQPLCHSAKSGLCRIEHVQGHAEAAVELCGEVLGHLEATSQSPIWRGRVGFMLAQAQWDADMPEQARRTAERARGHIADEDPLTAERIARWLEDPDAFVAEEQAKREEPEPEPSADSP